MDTVVTVLDSVHTNRVSLRRCEITLTWICTPAAKKSFVICLKIIRIQVRCSKSYGNIRTTEDLRKL